MLFVEGTWLWDSPVKEGNLNLVYRQHSKAHHFVKAFMKYLKTKNND